MFYVYILKSLKTSEFYKGLTNNLNRRFKQRFTGKVKATAGKLPLKLVHVEFFDNRIEARKFEKFLKTGFGREIIKEMVKYLEVN